ncbi:MAG: translation initiation factor IF-2 [Candidatus Kapaibacterium sp.]
MAVASGNKLFKVASQLNIGKETIIEFLQSKGFTVENKPTASLSDEMMDLVMEKYSKEAKLVEKQREKIEKHKAVSRRSDVAVSLRSKEQERLAEIAARDEAERLERERIDKERLEREKAERAAREQLERERLEREAAKKAQEDALRQEELAKQAKEQAVQPVVKEEAIVEPVAEAEVSTQQVESASETTAEVSDEAGTDQDSGGDDATETDADGTKKKRRRRKNVVMTTEPGQMPQLRGLTVLGKIDIAPPRPHHSPKKADKNVPQRGAAPADKNQKPVAKPGFTIGQSVEEEDDELKLRGRKKLGKGTDVKKKIAKDASKKKASKSVRDSISEVDVDKAIRQTLAGMEDDAAARSRSKIKQKKKTEREEKEQRRLDELERESGILRLTEFVTTAELANFIGVTPAEIITKCFSLGLMVSINQRLDKDTIQLIADDYQYQVEFITEKDIDVEEEIVDEPETLKPRPPIVTIMGHVDHGKTSLLDYIRRANVVAGEAGGITQHIGAYKVELPNGKSIAFLDTPGHEAFTAMRARGAQVTDVVVLVSAADDNVMPQTLEAISHAQAANVPMVVAINKVDKEDAKPDRVKQQLADHGVLVEEWGGKYQCAEISAKKGLNIENLLDKILLESELLELKANPDRPARGTVIEAHVDKGKGNVVTIMVQKGTMRVGDVFLCGQFFGRVRAMFDERGNRVEEAGPSTPVQVTGFEGLPESGDILTVSNDEASLREASIQRQILRREQQLRQVKHVTLDDISAQIKQGGVKELRLIIKTDVSGSMEALTDSLLKLSRDEVKVNILYRAVGSITESDVMLASASDAIIVGFQVQLPASVRKIVEREQVDVRLYSIIYDAINEVKLALEGMLSPDIKEEVTARVEVRQVFKISRLGQVAGCYVLSGTINRNDKIRIMRNGFEIYKGTIQSLKRVKDDAKEVHEGFECGITMNNFNDYEEHDIIEAYKIVETKRKFS